MRMSGPGILMRQAIADAVRERAEVALGQRAAGRRPCIVKPIGQGRRTRVEVTRLVRYIARSDRLAPADQEQEAKLAGEPDGLRPGDVIAVFDEWSNPVEDVEARIAVWALDSEDRGVQARHLVLSAPVDRPEDSALVEVAIGSVLRETLASWGYPLLWALHTDHTETPHVHVVVRTPPGLPLPLERDGLLLDALRGALARHCRSCGLDVGGERRHDRRNAGEQARLTELDRLERRVPNWVERWGTGYLARIEERLRPRDGDEDGPDNGVRMREDSQAAMAASLAAMMIEDPKLADWYRRNRAEAFGPADGRSWASTRAAFETGMARRGRSSVAGSLERLARAVEGNVEPAEGRVLAAALRRRAAEIVSDTALPTSPVAAGRRMRHDGKENER